MHNAITKNHRTHYVHVMDGRKFAITTEQYDMLRDDKAKAKPGDICYLTDADSGDIIFNGEFRAIKEFSQVKKRDKTLTGWYCGFGTKHSVHAACGCQEEYGVSELQFRDKAQELYVTYDSVVRVIGAKIVTVKHYHPFYSQDLFTSQTERIIREIKQEKLAI